MSVNGGGLGYERGKGTGLRKRRMTRRGSRPIIEKSACIMEVDQDGG